MPKIEGAGAVLPEAQKAPSPMGSGEIVIDGFDDSGLIRCVFPNGLIKHFQAADVSSLAGQITRQLRGIYGVENVEFETAPETIEAGQSFQVKG